MRLSIKTNLAKTHSRLDQMVTKGQIAFINQVYADTQPFVPKLSGDLRNQSMVTRDNKTIVWNAPYARKQYYNVGAKFTTPGTYARWDEMAKAVHKASWRNVIRKAMS